MPRSADETLARYVRRFGAETVLAALHRRGAAHKAGRKPIDDSEIASLWEKHMREDKDLADRSSIRKNQRVITEAARRAFEDYRDRARIGDFVQGVLQPKAIERLLDKLQFGFDDATRGFDRGIWSRKGLRKSK